MTWVSVSNKRFEQTSIKWLWGYMVASSASLTTVFASSRAIANPELPHMFASQVKSESEHSWDCGGPNDVSRSLERGLRPRSFLVATHGNNHTKGIRCADARLMSSGLKLQMPHLCGLAYTGLACFSRLLQNAGGNVRPAYRRGLR